MNTLEIGQKFTTSKAVAKSVAGQSATITGYGESYGQPFYYARTESGETFTFDFEEVEAVIETIL